MSTSSVPVRLRRVLTRFATILNHTRAIAFWLAIALPFGYLPLLAIDSVTLHPLVLVALIGLHVVTLVLGHDYAQ
ncbi:MAG: hypothetical protein ACQETB_05540 [Halobacteriota archaeon]